jgi:hypothetical protein
MPSAQPKPSNQNPPKLLDQVRDVLRTKHYSMRTEESYINWIKRYIIFHNKRHPAEMAEKEIAAQPVGYAVVRFIGDQSAVG